MTDEMDAWRERMRKRMRVAGNQVVAVPKPEPEPKPKPKAKPMKQPRTVAASDQKPKRVPRQRRPRLSAEERRAVIAEGTRAYHARLHEALVARGEKACFDCKQVLPLTAFRERSLPSGRPGWHPYCLECEREMRRKYHRKKEEGAA